MSRDGKFVVSIHSPDFNYGELAIIISDEKANRYKAKLQHRSLYA